MRRQWLVFAAGALVGIAVCLGSQWCGRWYNKTQVLMRPDTATNLALLYGVAIEADPKHPDLALQYWSEGRRPYVTQTELHRLAELALASPGTGIERYIGLRYGRPDDPEAKLVMLRVIEPGMVGNRYWVIEDELLFPAAEFDAHVLRNEPDGSPAT